MRSQPPSDRRVFGSLPEGVVGRPRSAAYAIIKNEDGRVAVVEGVGRAGIVYWLPGGGALPGESFEDTVTREVHEELGRPVQLIGTIGEAIQYFFASDDGCWYEMTAVFFRARFVGEPLGAAERELCWLDPARQGGAFFHPCHAWAALA